MPRIRSIKPEIRRDRKLARVSRESRYTFVLLWTVCDDQGFFLAEPRQLLGDLYPHDKDVDEAQLEYWLAELSPFLEFYDHEDGRIGRVCNWLKHQKIDKPSRSFLASLVDDLPRQPREGFASESRGSPETSPDRSLESRSLESRSLDLLWADFRNVYPKRSGGNRTGEAKKRFRARCKEGIDPQVLVERAQAYASYCDASGKTGTEHVAQMATWLGPNYEGWMQDWKLPVDADAPAFPDYPSELGVES